MDSWIHLSIVGNYSSNLAIHMNTRAHTQSILSLSKSITWPRAVADNVAKGIDADDAVRCSLAHHLNFQALNTKFTS